MSANQTQRQFALQIVRTLRDAGFEALWAGGSVRDQLLGKTPKDYDVATSARPEQVRELFGRRRTLAIGEAFGVISVLGKRGCAPIEVATFRIDGVYADGRHPDSVTYSDAEHDASRRDFTINGLFYDPLDEQVIDHVHGQEDLQQRMIRAIGDPQARFREDKLRMLRAVRFATTLGFEIEQQTQTAIRDMADEIMVVSAERIGLELQKILAHAQRAQGVRQLKEVGLLRPLLPELMPHAKPQSELWRQTLQHLKNLQTNSLAVSLATLLLPLDDPAAVSAIGRRLRYSNKVVARAAWLVKSMRQVVQADQLAWPLLQRLLVHDGIDDLISLAEAVLKPDHAGLKRCHEQLLMPREQLDPNPLVTGDDLIAHGIRPGKHFARLLEAIRDAQLEQRITDRKQALDMAEQWQESPQADDLSS